jgi:phage-related protein
MESWGAVWSWCALFVKKTQKTPRREIETALRRAKEVK